MKTKLFSLVLFCISFAGFSQDTIKSSTFNFLGRKWQKGTINFSGSLVSDRYYRDNYTSTDLFNESKHPERYTQFDKSHFNEYTYSTSGSLFNLSISFYPSSKKLNGINKNHELRLGIIYHKNISAEVNLNNKFYLSSLYAQYHTNVGPDTTFISYASYTQIIDQLGIEPTYIIRSPEFLKRFSFFAGIGAGFYYSVYSKVEEHVWEVDNQQYTSGSTSFFAASHSYQNQLHDNYNVFTIRGVVPYGLNFRLLNVLSFYIEGRTGIAYQKFLGATGRIKSQNGVGLGVRFKI